MIDQDEDFVAAGRPRFKTPPPNDFEFGPYLVHRTITLDRGLPRRGVAGGRSRLEVAERASGDVVVCEFAWVRMPLGAELLHGIAGEVDGVGFVVRRRGGIRLRRRHRTAFVTGAVDLRVGYEGGESVIRAGDGPAGAVLWTSASGGRLSRGATHLQAAVIAMLVVNAVDLSSSLRRWISYV